MCEIIDSEIAGCEHDYAKVQPPAAIPPPPKEQPATSTPAAQSCISSVLSDSRTTSDYCMSFLENIDKITLLTMRLMCLLIQLLNLMN